MKMIPIAVILLALGCATAPPENGPPGTEMECSIEGLADLVGRPASQELGAEALRRSGSRALRWIRPGDAVTMDYRTDRLNIHLMADGRVEGFDCG